MPDSAAARQRRSRAHKAGDHRMCDPRRCRELRAPLQVFAGDGDPQLGSTTVEMELWADALKIPAGDVRRPMVEAALQLARMIDAGQGMPAAARQFSHVVMSITEMSDPGDFLDEIRARMHARRVAMLAKAVEDGRYPYPEEDQS